MGYREIRKLTSADALPKQAGLAVITGNLFAAACPLAHHPR
jgi:hypothetical protein